MAYGSMTPVTPEKKEAKKETKKAPSPTKKSGGLSDKQKSQLKTHMMKHKDLQDLTPSQLKSHRMKMMVRLRKGMSMAKAHADIMK